MAIVGLRSAIINESLEIPSTAVFVANWREADVIGKMVGGHLARIPINNVKLYLGVYPNETDTLNGAIGLSHQTGGKSFVPVTGTRRVSTLWGEIDQQFLGPIDRVLAAGFALTMPATSRRSPWESRFLVAAMAFGHP